jgi:hypothetical protein
VECVDDNFGFSRYAERLGRSANSFDELYDAFSKNNLYWWGITFDSKERIETIQPTLSISIPFREFIQCFRSAQWVKKYHPIKISAGGGFPNTFVRFRMRVFWVFRLHYIRWWRSAYWGIINMSLSAVEKQLSNFLLEDGKVVYKIIPKTRLQASASGIPDYSDCFG